ncbi:Serine/threonine-protein kinase H1-like protein [Acropora cervicornis]|uniref:Serine/threonine-protein kinase H1-like protein n=1 Tax=Acropora cervicornis TaxID=6130 RepID=A0AAD9QEW2_ACRCE|nr:Serine/threonine-protein kinase H1-like protein [Acropora cervicornis]
MGCNNTKKLPEDEENIKSLKVPSREICCDSDKPSNETRKNTEKKPKKGRVVEGRYSFDPIVTDKYEIKALIGRGSFSRVVRVENKVSRQPYAIKMLRIREGKELFESELTVLRKVKHKYIVQLYEVYECAERVYLVMDLLTGGELFDRIASRGSFTERDATGVLFMVLEGVRYLHSLGITHRDLKPENLLYYHPGPDSKIMITDFGLSKSRQNAVNETMDTTCGTPEYIAPEILLRRAYTNAVDIWAIGVISYILLSGQMPFADDNRTRMYKTILKAKYSFHGKAWKDVSDLAKDFIHALLVSEPNDRMTAEECLMHPWIITHAGTSSLKNLQRSISQNYLKTSSRLHSARSNASQKSNRSTRSGRSVLSRKHSSNTNATQDVHVISAFSNAPAHKDTQIGSKAVASMDNSAILSWPLVEKEHSVINEDDREFIQNTASVSESTPQECTFTELEHNTKRSTTSQNQSPTPVFYRENQQPDRKKIYSLVLDYYTPSEAYEHKPPSIEVASSREKSHIVLKDNFLPQQHITHQLSVDTSKMGTPPYRLHPLSPLLRKNKIYCSYDSA